MSRPLRVSFPGALYLVTARAIRRQKLFRDGGEVSGFAGRLPALVDAYGAVVHGYCLVPSHYHLLLETPRGNLPQIVHRLSSGYTASVNARRRRKGPLFQSRYRALLLDEDPWLVRLSVRVHLNPVREKLTRDPWTYEGSSARAFAIGAEPFPGVDPRRTLALAGGREAYGRLMEEALRHPPPAPWNEVWRHTVLGGEALQARVLAALEGADVREVSGFSPPKNGLPLDDVLKLVSEHTGVDVRQLCRSKFQRMLARKMAMCLARRFTALTLRELGEAFGVDYTTVHMGARRLDDLRRKDPGLDALMTVLERELSSRTFVEVPAEASPADTPEEKPQKKRSRKKPEEGKPSRETAQLKLF